MTILNKKTLTAFGVFAVFTSPLTNAQTAPPKLLGLLKPTARSMHALADKADDLVKKLGNRSAGLYLNALGQVVVTVTDKDAVRQVTAIGAVPKMVKRGAGELRRVKADLDQALKIPGTAIRILGVDWETDPITNQVVVMVDNTMNREKLDKVKAVVARHGEAIRLLEYTPVVLQSLTGHKPSDSKITLNTSDSFKALIVWLQETGLGDLMTFSEFVDLRHLDRSSSDSLLRLASFAVEAGVLRNYYADYPESEYLEYLASSYVPIVTNGTFLWPVEVNEPDQAWLILRFNVKNWHELEATEERSHANNGIGLWNRILQKISSLEGIPTQRIVIVCDWDDLVFLDDRREAYRHEAYRYSRMLKFLAGSASAPLDIKVNTGAAATYSSTLLLNGLSEVVPKFLDNFFAPEKPTLSYLTTEADYFEVIVRGLRGQVIPGGSDWERLQITLSLTGSGSEKSPTLRVAVDGRLASGIGDFPSDSQFSRDIEPLYSENVTEYARKLADALRKQIEHQTDTAQQ